MYPPPSPTTPSTALAPDQRLRRPTSQKLPVLRFRNPLHPSRFLGPPSTCPLSSKTVSYQTRIPSLPTLVVHGTCHHHAQRPRMKVPPQRRMHRHRQRPTKAKLAPRRLLRKPTASDIDQPRASPFAVLSLLCPHPLTYSHRLRRCPGLLCDGRHSTSYGGFRWPSCPRHANSF